MNYIYKITNKINNKSYIGKTSHLNPLKRWEEHLKDSKKKLKSKRPLYSAINKYGEDNFIFEIIEETNIPEEREVFYINFYKTYKTGYNATLGGDGKSFINYEEVVTYYKEYNPSMKQLSEYFSINVTTARKILRLKGITHKPRIDLLSLPVIQKSLDDVFIKKHESIHHAARELGNENYNSNISRCCRNLRKSANGFKWEFQLQ